MIPLKPRPHYLNQLLTAPDTAPIKLITGMRRCGKSSLLRLLSEHLKAHGIPAAQIVTLDGERQSLSSTALYHHVKTRALPGQRLYLLCDEVQHVPAWAEAICALQADFDCAIYLTSSQRLSAADTSCLSGRYEEIKVLPLSWREFLAFKDEPGSNPEDLRTLFMRYLRYGGLPSLVAVSAEQAFTALDDSYAAVMLHDVLERHGARPLTDAQLLRTIAQYLAAHLGPPLSVSTLGPKVQATRPIPSFHTVQAYVRALCDSYCCTAVKRYDLKRHEYLSTLGKFYWADLGRCHYLSGALSSLCGQPELEHVVYWELIGRGYNVALGKLDQHEVSFIATRATERLYLQVPPSLRAPEHRSDVLTPLRKLDANSKLVLTLEPGLYTEAGITVRYVIDWLRDSFEQESESLSTGQAPRS